MGNFLVVQWLGLHASTAMGTGGMVQSLVRSNKLRDSAKKPKASKQANKKPGWSQLKSAVRQGRGWPVARGSSPLPASLPSHLCSSTCGKGLPPMVTHAENQSPFSLSVVPILPLPSALPCLQTQIPPETSICSLAFWQLSQPTGSTLGRKEQTHMQWARLVRNLSNIILRI